MAYIGSTPTSQNFIAGTDYFNGTGSQTAFTLTRSVNSVNDIEVVINNVVQQPSTAYTLSGTTITFTSAPSSGTNNIYVRYLATNMQSITVPNNSITYAKLDSNLQADIQGRNKIINGHMVVDQRNAGASVTPTSSGYNLDRFRLNISQSSKLSVQQTTTAPAGFTNSTKLTSLSSYSVGTSDYFVFGQKIEGYNTADLNWGSANSKTITISAWVQSSLTGTFSASVLNGNTNRSYPFTYTISAANTWQQISVTIAGDTSGTWSTTTDTGIFLMFSMGVGSTYQGTANTWAGAEYYGTSGATSVVGTSGATFYITGVQLEEGTTATSFERESYSETFAKCQRYYSVYQDWYVRTYQTGGVYFGSGMTLTVQMRTTPTMTIVGSTGYTNASGMVAICDQGNSAFKIYALTSSTGDSRFSCSGSSNYITASAEL
jgi:hypothetical protein